MISEPIMMSAMNFARAAIREADRTIPPIDAPVEIAVGGHVLASERDLRAVVTGPRDDAGGLATRRWTDEQRLQRLVDDLAARINAAVKEALR